MKLAIAVLITLVGLSVAVAWGQNPNRAPVRAQDRPGQEQRDESPLTTQQKATVKKILSRFNPSSLDAASAHAINEAFRAAGLRNGPALLQAIRDAGFSPERISQLDPPPGRPDDGQQASRTPGGTADGRRPARGEGGARENAPENRGKDRRGGGGYSIEQAVSDRAQLNTIAFSGLAFLTGDMGCNTFLPPGKVADYCGFQYMRDVDTNELGHNTSFVPRVANNVLYILTAEQRAKLIALAGEQEQMLTDFAQKRFPLIKAFSRQLEGNVPAGRSLSREAVMKYTASLYEIDGRLSYRRAEVMGEVIRSLTAEQKACLGRMAFDNSATWPEREDQVDKRSMSHTAHVAVMTYASELFSWYAGSVESDVYFCPERHATYFGAFYMKDMPAMGNPNYSISTSLTGDSGEAFLAALTPAQRALITVLVDRQRADLSEIVATRRAIATELRRLQREPGFDRHRVMALSRRYGELDGEISYMYAVAFAQVARLLTPEQKSRLLKLRNLDAKYACRGAFLFSRAIDMPEIPDTDFLFGAGSMSPAAPVPSPSSDRPVTITHAATAESGFVLRSPAALDGGLLPVEYTGDGAGSTLPLAWAGAPRGTRGFAVVMHHVPPDGEAKWYWLLYNLPASVQSLPRNVRNVGTLGTNSVNRRTEYAPPHSKGPGPKTYVYTVYALSAPVRLAVAPSEVTRDVLLSAMQGKVLGSAQLSVVYSRGRE